MNVPRINIKMEQILRLKSLAVELFKLHDKYAENKSEERQTLIIIECYHVKCIALCVFVCMCVCVVLKNCTDQSAHV